MVLLGILIAASASAVSEDAIRLQAARCGLKPDHLVWTKDAEGHVRADISPNGDLDSFSLKSMRCLLEWAEKSGVRVGFKSEPPPVAEPNGSVPVTAPVAALDIQPATPALFRAVAPRRRPLLRSMRWPLLRTIAGRLRLTEAAELRGVISSEWLGGAARELFCRWHYDVNLSVRNPPGSAPSTHCGLRFCGIRRTRSGGV
jgi:hypothetical protein